MMPLRDALADYRDVGWSVVVPDKAPTAATPLVSIVIPTFNRSELAPLAIASALAQTSSFDIEIIVVDNRSEPEHVGVLADWIRRNGGGRVRHVRNDSNIGMYGNWNRGIALAAGEWVTVLNDDDRLEPDFVADLMARIARDPRIDGIVCRKQSFALPGAPPLPSGRRNVRNRLRDWLMTRLGFDHRGERHLGVRDFFFSNVVGNTAGFLMRNAAARAVGGFYPEEYPSADYFFYARFAERYRLVACTPVLAGIGIGANDSARPETIMGFVETGTALRRKLVGASLPSALGKLVPMIAAHEIAALEADWRVRLDRAELARRLGFEPPAYQPFSMPLLKLWHTGAMI